MLNHFTGTDKAYIASDYTDPRNGIGGLVQLIRQQFELDPFTKILFLFCGCGEAALRVRSVLLRACIGTAYQAGVGIGGADAGGAV